MAMQKSKLPYVTTTKTPGGLVTVRTRQRYFFGLFPYPHTSVSPESAGELKRFGTVIKWTTDDPVQLEKLHGAVLLLVWEFGAPGLAEIANSAKMSERVWKALGRVGPGLHKLADEAGREGAPFPVPPEVLKYIRGFM
jgi:hypothetical protein